MRTNTESALRPHEHLLVLFEQAPFSAVYRVGIGWFMVELFSLLAHNRPLGWSVMLWFIGLLLALRLVPAVLRKLYPFSPQVQAIWRERRMMAKRFDSYQWQKLLWLGLGLSGYLAWHRSFDLPYAVLATICVVGGTLGLVVFQRRVAASTARLGR